MKNFGSNEWNGKDDEFAMKRIPELGKCIKEISAVIEEAERKGSRLVIKSAIKISFSKKTQ